MARQHAKPRGSRSRVRSGAAGALIGVLAATAWISGASPSLDERVQVASVTAEAACGGAGSKASDATVWETLRAENAFLRAAVEALEQGKHERAQIDAAAAAVPQPRTTEQGPESGGEQTEDDSRPLSRKLEDRFAADSHDTVLTHEVRDRLEAHRAEREELAETEIASLACGRELCRTELVFNDELAKARVLGILPLVLALDGKTDILTDEHDPLRIRVFSQLVNDGNGGVR